MSTMSTPRQSRRATQKARCEGSAPRGTALAAAGLTVLVFAWIVAAMLSALVAAASAVGIYEALLAAELGAAVVLLLTWLMWRRRTAPSADDRVRLRRDRERRGF